jgi:hypothetical protein
MFSMPDMETETKNCPDCRAIMTRVTATLVFRSFECPSCHFVVIETAKQDAPEGRTVADSH